MKKEFALKIFEAFSIERWNDLVRPFELVEMDKQAERLVIAYILAKFEENKGTAVDWDFLIYASFFDLLKKIQLCDIKSPVQNLIRKEYFEEYTKLNLWVLEKYKNLIDDEDLYSNFASYVNKLNKTENLTKEQKFALRIFKAANKYATLRELDMITPVNEEVRIKHIRGELNAELQTYLDLRGLQLLVTKQKPFEFLLKIEQLRFQTRWNQTPRIPKSSVLGHCFFVAVLTLLFCRESQANLGYKMSGKRLYNNFFSALFHDLPESVTRDIISPVKQATDGFPEIIKNIEDQIVKKELVPLMEPFYKNEILYFTSNEFSNRIINDSQIREVEFEQLNTTFASEIFNPVDGKLVRLADHYSAYLEASLSIRHGITSVQLEEGKQNLINLYADKKNVNGIDASKIFV